MIYETIIFQGKTKLYEWLLQYRVIETKVTTFFFAEERSHLRGAYQVGCFTHFYWPKDQESTFGNMNFQKKVFL